MPRIGNMARGRHRSRAALRARERRHRCAIVNRHRAGIALYRARSCGCGVGSIIARGRHRCAACIIARGARFLHRQTGIISRILSSSLPTRAPHRHLARAFNAALKRPRAHLAWCALRIICAARYIEDIIGAINSHLCAHIFARQRIGASYSASRYRVNNAGMRISDASSLSGASSAWPYADALYLLAAYRQHRQNQNRARIAGGRLRGARKIERAS